MSSFRYPGQDNHSHGCLEKCSHEFLAPWERSVPIPTVDDIRLSLLHYHTTKKLAKSILGSFNLVHLPATAAAPNDELVLTGWRSR